MEENLIESMDEFVENISNIYIELIEEDIFEVGSEFFKIFQKTKVIADHINKAKFTCFLKGISNSDDIHKSFDRLSKYVSNRKYSYQIIKYIENVHSSNSVICCFILGLLMSKTLNGEQVTYESLNLQTALQYVTDMDIENLISIIEYNSTSQNVKELEIFDETYFFTEWCKENSKNYEDLIFTAEKFSNYVVFKRELLMDTDLVGNQETGEYGSSNVSINGEVYGYYKYNKTESSQLLFEIINQSKTEIITLIEKLKNVT